MTCQCQYKIQSLRENVSKYLYSSNSVLWKRKVLSSPHVKRVKENSTDFHHHPFMYIHSRNFMRWRHAHFLPWFVGLLCYYCCRCKWYTQKHNELKWMDKPTCRMHDMHVRQLARHRFLLLQSTHYLIHWVFRGVCAPVVDNLYAVNLKCVHNMFRTDTLCTDWLRVQVRTHARVLVRVIYY